MTFEDHNLNSDNMHVRRASVADIPHLIHFTLEEAKEAERIELSPKSLELGISRAIEDDSKAMYWVLVDDEDAPVGSISIFREWSDWQAGYYWWIQSIYLTHGQRGKGRISLLLDEVKSEMSRQKGLELRLYVHRDNKVAIRAYEKAGFEDLDYRIMRSK